MESRKYQLQKQIIEALESNDSDLYTLLKSQWAHRFGVESLEELKNLELHKPNENPRDLDEQKIDQSKKNSFEGDKSLHLKDGDNQEKEIKTNESESIDFENDESFRIKSNTLVEKENCEYKPTNIGKEKKSQIKIDSLIPLPPKPKYSYLKKWLLVN